MGHTPHELHEEFPAQAAAITRLKTSDPEFAALAEAYHEVNRAIHRMETEVETVSDEVLEETKKKRLALKDQVAARLAAA